MWLKDGSLQSISNAFQMAAQQARRLGPNTRDKSELLSGSILGSHHLSFPLHGPYYLMARPVLAVASKSHAVIRAFQFIPI